MEALENLWSGPGKYVVIFMAIIMIAYVPSMIIYMNKKKKGAAEFLNNHPDASKVLIAGAMKGIITVLTVNGDAPVTFYEENKKGFFLLPGENVVEAQYTWSRPGIMYKTVTTTIGPSKIKLTAEFNKKYYISFDKKEEVYNFEEMTK